MANAGLQHWADILTVILYFLFVIAIGIWSIWRKKKGNVEGYFLAGRAMPWFAVGASIFGSNIGSEHFVGLAGSGAAMGIVFVLFEWIPALIIQALSWFFLPVFISAGGSITLSLPMATFLDLVRTVWAQIRRRVTRRLIKVYTLPEYMGKRFGGQRIRLYLSVLALFLHIVSRLSATIFSGAVYIQLALNWNMYPSIIGLLIITAVFTIFGGLTAVIYTDTAQSIIMVVGAFVVMALSLDKIGGYENLVEAYQKAIPTTRDVNSTCGIPREDAFDVIRGINSDYPWPTIILQCGVASAWYWICDQIMVQRCLAAKNLSHAKGGTLLGGYLKILPLFIMIIPGMISRILYTDEVACVDPDVCQQVCDNPAGCTNIAYPKLVLELLPQGARGLIMAVMLSAIVTSLTSIFNSSSTVFTMDIWRRIRPKANQRELLLVGRAYILALCVLTILWIPVVKAAQGGQLFKYIVVVEGFVAAPLPILFSLAVFWDRTTEKGAFYGLVFTHVLGVVRLILEVVYPAPNCGDHDTRPAFLSQVHSFYYSEILMVIQLVLVVIISLCTTRRTQEQIHGTTWSTRLRVQHDTSDIILKTMSTESVELGSQKTASENIAAEDNLVKDVDDDGVMIETESSTWGRLSHLCAHVCGVPDKIKNAAIDITVKDRLHFLKESSKTIQSVNNALAIFLVAVMAFLIGYYK